MWNWLYLLERREGVSTLLKLFLTFLKIGAFTFGGGYAMLPMVQQEVLQNGWMKQEEIVNFIAVSEATPGPFAVNVSTYVGSTVAGIAGAFFATLGVILPSFIIILIVARIFDTFQKAKGVKGMMLGLHPAVVGLIGASVVSVGSQVFFPNGVEFSTTLLFSLVVAMISIYCSFKKHVHPIILIVFSAIIGIVAGYVGML